MKFDFSSINNSTDLTSITDPIALFDALPNKQTGLGYLRQVQATVLERWSPRRTQTDLVVKMNTGTGKTIVGLLILQASLHDKGGPALYLAPDPHLADRVTAEARRLGLVVTDDPKSFLTQSGEAICVTSLQRLINGKTRFGLTGGADPTKIGSIVIDDAHSAISLLEESSRITVPADHPAYGQLLDLFVDDLKQQSLSTLLDIQAGEYGAVMRIPFWSWQDKASQVLGVLHPLRRTPLLEWEWPLIGDHIPACVAMITSRGIEISPPLPPIQKFPSFVDARRRIYMTATLANDSALVTHFGADPAGVAQPVVPDSAADLGDRLLLAPQELLPDLSDHQVRETVAGLAVTDNVVVLVPSWARAREWSDVADTIASTADEISEAVETLRAGAAGLVVIINRYDGIDLPGDACRVLVIDGLPLAASAAERREASALRDTGAVISRQVQRFEQGLGRAVRSREDRCAVLALDRRLVELISRPDVPGRLSPGTRAQLEMSRQVARQLTSGQRLTLDDLIELVRTVIEGAEGFKTAARQALLNVRYETAPLAPTAAPLRAAYEAVARGDLESAARHADIALVAARKPPQDDRLVGWLTETAAAYRHPVDPVTAQSMLSTATALNSSVLRPIGGLAFTPRRPMLKQAETATAYLSDRYPTGSSLRLGVESLISDLAWDPERTEEAEQALADLGAHLGFTSQRPEKETGHGGDVLWGIGDQNYVALEAKTGVESDEFIAKHDVDQLGGYARWCQTTFNPSGVVTPVMVHPSNVIHRTGTAPAGMRVIDRDHLALLIGAVRSFASALAVDDAYRDAAAVRVQLAGLRLNGRQLAETYAVGAGSQRS